MAPLLTALRDDPRFDSSVCVTGQHREMLDQVLTIFDIQADYDLNLMYSNQTLSNISAQIIAALEPVVADEKPDLLLVHGDTITTFCAAFTSFLCQTPVGHVEAGLRSFDLSAPWPEEGSRQLVSRVTEFHFAPTELAKQNLLAEKVVSSKIHVTGNTVIDALLMGNRKISSDTALADSFRKQFDFLTEQKNMILVTGHRRESFGSGFIRICAAIRQLAKRFPNIDIVYPVHLNPNVQDVVLRELGGYSNIHLIPPQDYLPFIFLMQRSLLILTDSGGVQEEAPSLGKPVLVMRDNTERPEAVNAGTVKLVGTEVDKIVQEASYLIIDDAARVAMSKKINPYGDGQAVKRILQILSESL